MSNVMRVSSQEEHLIRCIRFDLPDETTREKFIEVLNELAYAITHKRKQPYLQLAALNKAAKRALDTRPAKPTE